MAERRGPAGLLLVAVVMMAASGPPATQGDQGPFDVDRTYGALLEDVVTSDGLVRYGRLLRPVARRQLEQVVTYYATTALPENKSDRLAFLMNAYNANVLSQAFAESRRPGFRSVLEVPGFFDERTVMVAKHPTTINGIENDQIRPHGDPRIHAALVCAAMSCPPLRREPFAAARLDEQLDDQCRRWIDDETKNRAAGARLELSEIFKWYADDFETAPYEGAIGFVLAFASPATAIRKTLDQTRRPKVSYLTYDWALNQAPPPD